jgi:NarL family two-component system response regulator LiaR
MTLTPIRVLIADDHDMVREGLRTFLLSYDHLELVGEARNGKEAVELYHQLKPDVTLMDLVMPVMDGLEAVRQIKDLDPDARVLALTSFTDPGLLQRSLQAGVSGFLLKDTTSEELMAAIEDSFAGETVISPEATRLLMELAVGKHQGNEAAHPTHFQLTDREMEVLVLLVKGLTNRQIALRLAISTSTVKTYVSNILSKLDVSSRAEAVAVALQSKLIS